MKPLALATAFGVGMVSFTAKAALMESQPALRVVELRCEHRTDPSGLLPPNTTGTVEMPYGQTHDIGSGVYHYEEPFQVGRHE